MLCTVRRPRWRGSAFFVILLASAAAATAASSAMIPSLSLLMAVGGAWSFDLRRVAAPVTCFHRGPVGCASLNDKLVRGTGLLPPIFASKWDDLIDEDDELEFNGPPVPKDMKYNFFNIKRMRDTFDSIRNVGGKEITNDVYVKDPEADTFWFAGKVARVSDVSVEMTVARLWPMVEEHAARLRTVELHPKWGTLEIWTAPGDTELDVAYNRPNIRFIKMDREVDGASDVRNVEVGFQGEVYEKDENGFRTVRTEDGLPLKPEITQTIKEKGPSDADMDDMMEILNSQVQSEES